MIGYMKYIKIDIGKIKLYTNWDSSVGWGWGMISTIRVCKDGFHNSSNQSIHRWLYD